MTAEQKLGYVAAIAGLERALNEVNRAAVITQVGLNHVVNLNQLAKNLDATVWNTRAQRVPKQKFTPAERDTTPMRPNYRGD